MSADGTLQTCTRAPLAPPWTIGEEAILRAHYPVCIDTCRRMLPLRTRNAIKCRAQRLGLRSSYKPTPPPDHNRKPADPFRDAAIRALYESKPTRRDVCALAQRWGVAESYVRRRALQLGLVLPRFGAAAWTDAEDTLLESLCAHAPHTIAARFRTAGYRRTAAAISIRMTRIDAHRTDALALRGIYTPPQIAAGLGITAAAVSRWIASGNLRATPRDSNSPHVVAWHITARDLVAYLTRNWARLDLRRADVSWIFGAVLPAALT